MTRSRPILGFVFGILCLGFALLCCGKSKNSPSPGGVDGIPGSWDGQADYELDGWRFETP